MKVIIFICIILFGLLIGYIGGLIAPLILRKKILKVKSRKKYSFDNEIVITKLESNAKEYGSKNEDYASKEY